VALLASLFHHERDEVEHGPVGRDDLRALGARTDAGREQLGRGARYLGAERDVTGGTVHANLPELWRPGGQLGEVGRELAILFGRHDLYERILDEQPDQVLAGRRRLRRCDREYAAQSGSRRVALVTSCFVRDRTQLAIFVVASSRIGKRGRERLR
jgi:hypothetical protein